MLECQYGSEPFDLRLLLLRLWGKAGKMGLAVILCTLLLGGGYYMKAVVLAPERYVATSLYQVEYAIDPVTDNEYTFINGSTWDTWMRTKEFLDLLYRRLEGTPDAQISRDVMKGYLSAGLQSDLRMPDTSVTTPKEALSLRLAAAVEQCMVEFAQGQKGIDNIRVVDPAVQVTTPSDARPLRAFILAAVVSAFLILVAAAIREIGDDGIWLPVTLKQRYGLPVLGTVESPGFSSNVRWLLRDCRQAAVLPVGAEKVSEELLKALENAYQVDGVQPEDPPSFRALPQLWSRPDLAGLIREADGLVLAVEAGSHMGRKLEEVLEDLDTQGCKVTAALLAHGDEALIRRYYWREALGKKTGRSREALGKKAGRSGEDLGKKAGKSGEALGKKTGRSREEAE